jgi:photosystem II stability/assembly factor-like uncharacterized protein
VSNGAAAERPRDDQWWLFGAIRAARRRMWRRRLAIGLLLAVVAAVGAITVAGSGGGGRSGLSVARNGSATQPGQSLLVLPTPRLDPTLSLVTGVDPGPGVALVSRSAGLALSPAFLGGRYAGFGGNINATLSPRVLASADGGRTFFSSLSSPDGFWGVDAAGGEAWVVGFDSVYRTAGVASAWERMGEPSAPLVRVAFANANEGFGLTNRGRLVFSFNAGRSWRETGQRADGAALCSVGLGSSIVATANGTLWRVSDRGTSWTRIAAGYARVEQLGPWWPELSCNGRNVVESVQAICEAACAGAINTRVRQSTDGGFTWRQIADQTTTDNGLELPHSALGGIWMIAARGTDGLCLGGGDRWIAIRCNSPHNAAVPSLVDGELSVNPDIERFIGEGPAFQNATTGWVLVGATLFFRHGPGRSDVQAWITHDGGRTWSPGGTITTHW